jgi:hypothetical protein
LTTPRSTPDRLADPIPTSWQRLPALSGIAFAVLLVVGFLISGGDTPDYTAGDREWTNWAEDNELASAIGALLTLLAGLVSLPFAATIRGSGVRRPPFAALRNSRESPSRAP